MFNLILRSYRFIFARKIFYSFNKFLYKCSLSGLGVLNYSDNKVSGEENFLYKFSKYIDEPTVFDVGANIGKYAKKILDISPNSKIYLFEPHPKNFEILSTKLSDCHDIMLNNFAVGHELSMLKLYDYENKPSSHASLYKAVIEEIHSSKSASYDVSVMTLDQFTFENSIKHIDLLKIDVEGHELNVLLGAKKLLSESRISVIQFEFNEMNAISHSFMRDFMNILPDFSFYRLLPNGFLPLTHYSPIMIEIFAYQNIVAVHKKSKFFL